MFHQLDIRIDKTWYFQDGVKMSAYLDVYNAYNQGNVEGVSYNYNSTLLDLRDGHSHPAELRHAPGDVDHARRDPSSCCRSLPRRSPALAGLACGGGGFDSQSKVTSVRMFGVRAGQALREAGRDGDARGRSRPTLAATSRAR